MEFIKKEPLIFIISGKAKSGKDVVCQKIQAYFSDKKCIRLAYADSLKEYARRISGWDGREETKPRRFLQNLGIELIHDQIDPRLLIRRVIEDIRVFSYFYDVIIITDARLTEEIEIPRHEFANVTVIRIEKTNDENGLTVEEKNHRTETELDQYHDYDYVIKNEGTIEELHRQVEQIMKEVLQ